MTDTSQERNSILYLTKIGLISLGIISGFCFVLWLATEYPIFVMLYKSKVSHLEYMLHPLSVFGYWLLSLYSVISLYVFGWLLILVRGKENREFISVLFFYAMIPSISVTITYYTTYYV